LSKAERKEIRYFLDKGYSIRKIGKILKRSPNTISREIKNNSVRGEYDPEKANHKSYVKRHYASFRSQKIVMHKKLRKFIEAKLCDDQSPEAISGRLKYQEKDLPYVSKNTIYDFLDSPYGKLIKEKRIKKRIKYRKKKFKINKLKDRKFIDKRPEIVEKRERTGDVEGDFIVSGKSGKGYLLVLVDRKTRYVFIEQILEVTVDNVHESLLQIKKEFPLIKTLTLDNDILFRMHKTLETILNIPIYFCHPYHSWEKGSVENVNKFIRKYIPKSSNISKYDEEYIKAIQNKCNDRFMKCLNYLTPSEALANQKQRLSVVLEN